MIAKLEDRDHENKDYIQQMNENHEMIQAKLKSKDEYVQKLKDRVEQLESQAREAEKKEGEKPSAEDPSLRQEHEELLQKYKHLKLKYKEKQEDLMVIDELKEQIYTLKKARDGYRNQALDQKVELRRLKQELESSETGGHTDSMRISHGDTSKFGTAFSKTERQQEDDYSLKLI